MSWNDRLEMTAKNLSKLKPLSTPPTGFDPLKATDEELIKAGLPRRPDPKTQPGLHAKWKAIMSRSVTHVPSRFHLITQPRDPLLRGLKKTAATRAGPAANSTSSNWCGAVVFGLDADDSYVSVSGSWTVPNAYRRLGQR
jgi:hypothetical protein